MDVSRTITEGYKVYLAGGGMLLALVWHLIPRRVAMQLLIALTLLSGLNYARWGVESATERLDAYDLMHYYVNAKYFDELGYLDLYPAVILADHEAEGPFFEEGPQYMAQDETGHGIRPIRHALARGEVVRQTKFTPERWEAFSHDVLYLQRTVGCGMKNRRGRCVREFSDHLWREMIQDHGFNGTTAWTLIARPITQVVPVEAVKLLGYIDVVWLAVALGALTWAYGGATALWTLCLLLVSYSTRWPYITWVFLRYDWVAAMLIAMALLKKGRPLGAGLFAGYSATLRMFPTMWMWGPAFKGLAGLTRGHVHKQLLWLAAGFLISVAALQGAATAVFGAETVEIHLENMMDHNSVDQLSSRRIGLALALNYDGALTPKLLSPERRQTIKDQKPLRYGLGAIVLVVMGWGMRRARDDEAFGFGFIPFFLFTTASYYYYVARVTLATVHAAELSTWRHRLGLASLFGLEVFSNWAETRHPGHRMFLIGWLAWGLALYTVVMMVWLNLEAYQADKRGDAL